MSLCASWLTFIVFVAEACWFVLMSVICRTFVQNAWRSDLCSNCFKSLEDHTDGTARRNNVCEKLSMPRYVPQAASLYQVRNNHIILSNYYQCNIFSRSAQTWFFFLNGKKVKWKKWRVIKESNTKFIGHFKH